MGSFYSTPTEPKQTPESSVPENVEEFRENTSITSDMENEIEEKQDMEEEAEEKQGEEGELKSYEKLEDKAEEVESSGEEEHGECDAESNLNILECGIRDIAITNDMDKIKEEKQEKEEAFKSDEKLEDKPKEIESSDKEENKESESTDNIRVPMTRARSKGTLKSL